MRFQSVPLWSHVSDYLINPISNIEIRSFDFMVHDFELIFVCKCYSVDEFFDIHQVNKTAGFKLEEFQRLSPALLQQIESGACSESSPVPDSEEVADKYSKYTAISIRLSFKNIKRQTLSAQNIRVTCYLGSEISPLYILT